MVLVSLARIRIPFNYKFPSAIAEFDAESKMCWFLVNESESKFTLTFLFFSADYSRLEYKLTT